VKVPKKFEFMALSARAWLDDLHTDSSHPRSPPQLKADFATAMRWLGISSFSEIRPGHYERWSAAFVCYLAEGKAPSASLKAQFEASSQWAKEDPPLFVALDDEIRGVFRRLLVPDQEPPKEFGFLRSLFGSKSR
jgi:hypothetical protein